MQTETEVVCRQGFNWWFRDHQGLGAQGVGKCRELSLRGWAGFGEVGGRRLGPGRGGLGGAAGEKQYSEDRFGERRGRGGTKEQKGKGTGFGGEGRCLVSPRI